MSPERPIVLRGQPIAQGRVPAIITPLVGRDEAELDAELAVIVPKQPDLLEWRIDFFAGIGDVPRVLAAARRLRERAGGIPLLLTRRNVSEGGQPLAVDEAAVLAMYAAAIESGDIDAIDYELSNAEADLLRLRELSRRHGVAMVVSYHNFQLTPDVDTLVGKFEQAERLGADVAKVAVMPQSPTDVLRLLEATWRATQSTTVPLVSMSMGALGAVSRVMGWQYGSSATFAVGKGSSAPGQVAVEELRALLAGTRRAAGRG